MTTGASEISTARRRDVIDALRRGTVPQSGLGLFAVGLNRFEATLDDDLGTVARGGSAFHALRGEYGSGKTFFARWLAERAKRRGLAVSEVQISETETPLHRLETVYRRLTERLTTATHQPSALRSVIDSWFYALEEEVLAGGDITEDDEDALAAAVDELLERRLADVARTTPAFSAALRGYRQAVAAGDVSRTGGRAAFGLVSAHVDHQAFFSGLNAVVVDEVHAFAGDDRGWHLLAVLERLSRVVGHPLQRIGLSATVGNPDELLAWLQGSGRGRRPARVVAPHLREQPSGGAAPAAPPPGDIELDYVGSVANAATVIAALHRGEKRLVFCESRRTVEELGEKLRLKGVTTFLSHASLSVDERRRAETAFTEARDCVIVSTSTLEPIDVGDLDHLVAQQLLALCLQEHRVGENLWQEWWGGVGPFGPGAAPVVRHLVEQGYLDQDGGLLFVGPEAERRYGHRHFMNLTAVFTAPPEFTVLNGRTEIGRTDPDLLTEEIEGPRKLLLAGRNWLVTYIDWTRKRCFVEPADEGGRARWNGFGAERIRSFALARAARDVLLGDDPPVRLTKRATAQLTEARDAHLNAVHPGGTVVTRSSDGDVRWWTWAGHRANATLAASLPSVVTPHRRVGDQWIRLRDDLTAEAWKVARADSGAGLCLPEVDSRAVRGLKFGEALPPRLAEATLAARTADEEGAGKVLAEPARFVTLPAE